MFISHGIQRGVVVSSCELQAGFWCAACFGAFDCSIAANHARQLKPSFSMNSASAPGLQACLQVHRSGGSVPAVPGAAARSISYNGECGGDGGARRWRCCCCCCCCCCCLWLPSPLPSGSDDKCDGNCGGNSNGSSSNISKSSNISSISSISISISSSSTTTGH